MKRWGDFAAWGALALTVLFFGFLLKNDYRSVDDRRALHEESERLKRETQAQRAMLDARAEIQVILVKRARENRPLTREEVRRIDELWQPAEYHLAGNATKMDAAPDR